MCHLKWGDAYEACLLQVSARLTRAGMLTYVLETIEERRVRSLGLTIFLLGQRKAWHSSVSFLLVAMKAKTRS